MGNGETLLRGHPTVASQLSKLGAIPNQANAAFPQWWIDPINGKDTNKGTLVNSPLKTRTEFARRMFGVTLTQNITVHITSSLLANDDGVPFIFGNVDNNWAVNYIGTPTELFRGLVTGYVARNGATATVTQMTIAGIPVSWTASGLVGFVIEKLDGSIGSVVVKDLGAKTAWLSPPISIPGLIQDQVFAIGDTVRVLSLPDFGEPVVVGGFNSFRYLSTTSRWQLYWGRNDLYSCSGGVLGNTVDGSMSLNNHANGNPAASFHTNTSGRALIHGGWNYLLAVAGNITFSAHATLSLLVAQNGTSVTTGGQSGTPADLEFNVTSASPTGCIEVDQQSSARVDTMGNVYGVSSSTSLARFRSRSGRVSFSKTPNVTGAINAFFELLNITEPVSRLTSTDFVDKFDNRVVGISGPRTDYNRFEVGWAARGVITETFPIAMQANSTLLLAGQVNFTGIALRAGDVITNVNMVLFAAGVGLTTALIGIYDKAGNRLAISADQSANWLTTGLKVTPLTAPLTITTTDMYYVGIFAAGGTLPNLIRGNITTTIPPHVVGAGVSYMYGQAGLATLPNPAVYSTALTVVAHWFELS